MDVSDLIFSHDVDMDLKRAVLDTLNQNNDWYAGTPVLIPTDTNDDVNGSQHASNGGTDFTYRDATGADVENGVTALGYYEYFSNEGDHYTGHYYNGDRRHFAALVLNPPAYAATVTV